MRPTQEYGRAAMNNGGARMMPSTMAQPVSAVELSSIGQVGNEDCPMRMEIRAYRRRFRFLNWGQNRE